jgi:Rrf2 family transcriptional regulator, cysteine metabolism repressor
LITTVRGAKGGYYLSRSPQSINLMDVVRILEGPICFVDCVENSSLCDRAEVCISREVWEEVSRKVEEILSGITLENLMERQRSKTPDSAMFI